MIASAALLSRFLAELRRRVGNVRRRLSQHEDAAIPRHPKERPGAGSSIVETQPWNKGQTQQCESCHKQNNEHVVIPLCLTCGIDPRQLG